ncbi:MAG: choice-of-anchor D domain-containing protein [Myxococcota bacterium]
MGKDGAPQLKCILAASLIGLAGCDCGDASLRDVAPHLSVDATAVDFGEVMVGDLRVKGLKLTNDGDSVLDLLGTEISGSPEFSITVAAPMQLAPQETVDLVLTYAPVDLGPDDGTLKINAKDKEGLRTISLHGVGVRGALVLLPPRATCKGAEGSVGFGAITPGQTADEALSLQNQGSGPLTLLSAAMAVGSSPELSVDPIAAPKTLAPGEQVVLRAHYAPVDGGEDNGTIEVTTDSPERPLLRIPVCGSGIAAALCAHPSPVDLGRVAVGSTARATVQLESCGTEPLNLSGIALASDAAHPTDPRFAVSTTAMLPATLAPGQHVEAEISFAADRAGAATGFLRASSNAFGAPEAYVPLLVEGAPPCALTMAPGVLNFSGVAVGQRAQKSVLALNAGASACHVTRIEITPGQSPFTLTPSPVVPVDVPAGGQITLSVEYAPTANQQDQATLEVEEASGVQRVSLIGAPLNDQVCTIDVSPTPLTFGLVAVGQELVRSVELHNVSRVLCTVRGVALGAGSSSDFSSRSRSLRLIPSGGRIQLEVAYHPAAAGSASGTLVATSNDPALPNISVPLIASSAPSGICVTPPQISFGTVPVPTVAEADVRIYACGASAVTVSALDWTTAAADISMVSPPSLPFTLAPGADRSVRIRYAPTAVGADRAVLTVRSDDPARPAIDVPVTGAAFQPATEPVYLHTPGDLYSLDPSTMQLNHVGAFNPALGLAQMIDIAIDLRGAMYGIDNGGQVYSVDPTTARLSPLFQYENGGAPGLTCLSNGKLVAAGFELTILDPVTGHVDQTVVPQNRFTTSGDVVALPDGMLYWSITDGNHDALVRVDPSTGATTQLPNLPTTEVYGLGYVTGQLLGFSAGGQMLLLDSATGAQTGSQQLPGQWYGATTNPVRW